MRKLKTVIILLSMVFVCAITMSITYANSLLLHATSEDGKVQLNWENPFGDAKNYPYAYRLFKSTDNGATYKTVSMWTENDEVKVLNLYPDTNYNVEYQFRDGTRTVMSKAAALKIWMEGGTMIEGGVAQQFDNYGRDLQSGRQLIKVDPVSYSQYNGNPDGYLKDASGNYKYDVVALGTWDANNWQDINQPGANALAQFIQSGRGAFFGHDTLYAGTSPILFNTLASYVGITSASDSIPQYTGQIGSEDGKGGISSTEYSQVKIVSKSTLTSYPWNIGDVGTILTVPGAHNLQAANGQILMRFQHPTYTEADNVPENFFLTLHNNTAMSQTGHSIGNSTEDERKILANTMFYLKQVNTAEHAADADIIDQLAPDNLTASILGCPAGDAYQKRIRLSAKDRGTVYKYYIEGIPQIEGHGSKMTSGVAAQESYAGIDSYWYTITTSRNAVQRPSVNDVNWHKANSGNAYDFDTGEMDHTKTQYVHYYVKDKVGNISSESVYEIPSNSAPVISIQSKEFFEGQFTDEEWKSIRNDGLLGTDYEDGILTSNVELVSDTTNVNVPGQYKVIYKVKDSGCVTTVKENSITVKFNNSPKITAQAQSFYENEKTIDEWKKIREEIAQASDIEDGDITDKITILSDNVDPAIPGNYEIIYQVTDAYGKTTTETVEVEIKYNNPPVITANDLEFYENEKTVDEWKALRDKIATASDIEDGDITDRIELVEDNVNPAIPDTYQVVYKVTDAYGKSDTKTVNVNVKFNNFPELTVVKKSYYENEMHREEWEKTLRMQDITADDVEDGDITSKIKVMADNIDFEKAGKYQVKYRVTDRWGKSGEAEAEVEIKYNNPPVITAEDKVFTEGEYTNKDWKDTLLMQDITAEDIEDGDVTKLITVKSDTVDATVPGWYQVVYTVTDQWGKTTDKAISVNVKYNAVPVIHAENKAFHENEYGADWMDKVLNDVTAEDVEDGNVTDKIEIIKNNVDPKTPGSYEVTFKVVDSLGKSTTKTIDITVLENVKPVLQIFAEDKRFVEGQYTLEEWINELRKEDVAAHDHEDHDLTDKVVIIKDETDPAKPGRYEVTYKVTDRWGKTAEKTVHVTVEPNVAPVIYANDKWFTIGENIDEAALLKNVTAIDDHDGDVSKNVTIQSSNVKANVIGEYKVVYTVADQYGKSATKEVVVHVEGPGGNVVPPQPPIVTDPEAIQLWNGKQMGNVILKKVMEDSIFEQNGWQDVTFGVFTAEDIVYKGKVVLAKDSMVDIVKPDKHGNATATIYTAGKYYVKELSTNGSYNLDPNIYTFTFTYE